MFLNSKEKKKINAKIKEIYGFSPEGNFISAGKKKIRLFSGDISKDNFNKLAETIRIEITGMYFASFKDTEPRLSFDAVSLFRKEIKKRIFEITKEDFEKWIRGYDLEKKSPRGTLVLKFKKDFVGIGKSNGEKIFNYVPKERKLKTPIPKSDF